MWLWAQFFGIKENMIHGIYEKSRPKNKWRLVALSISQEAANHEVDERKKQALLDGNEDTKVGVQIFDTVFYIPEYVDEIKEQQPQFN